MAEQLPTWLSAWELDSEESQKLHLAIADAATAAGDEDLSQSHVVQALQTIPAAESTKPAARELAVRALASALRRPAVFDFTPLTASDAVQALRTSDTTLFELLEIFTSDTLDAYEEFVAANPLASISNGVLADASDALQTKMRLLTLTSWPLPPHRVRSLTPPLPPLSVSPPPTSKCGSLIPSALVWSRVSSPSCARSSLFTALLTVFSARSSGLRFRAV